MTRRLLNFCLAWTLVFGCGGGVLAAAACPHTGCRTAAAAPAHDAHHAAQHPPRHEGHSAHAQSHQGHHAEQVAHEQPRSEAESLTALASPKHRASCLHCVGGPQAPPSTKSEARPGSAQKADGDSAAQIVRHLPPTARVLVRKIAPSQHAPPCKHGRHLLFSVFLI